MKKINGIDTGLKDINGHKVLTGKTLLIYWEYGEEKAIVFYSYKYKMFNYCTGGCSMPGNPLSELTDVKFKILSQNGKS